MPKHVAAFILTLSFVGSLAFASEEASEPAGPLAGDNSAGFGRSLDARDESGLPTLTVSQLIGGMPMGLEMPGPTQASVDPDIVAQYVAKIRAGVNVEPIRLTCYSFESRFCFITDGHHRFVAHRFLGKRFRYTLTKSTLAGAKNWDRVSWERFEAEGGDPAPDETS